ncbi:unnamed protein product, partial [Phaeothamnion confervicola]
LLLNGCVLQDVAVGEKGGVLFLDAETKATIHNTTFINCISHFGGAVYIEGLNTALSGCTFYDVTARTSGEAVRSGSSKFHGSAFQQHISAQFSGAIALAGSAAIDSCRFDSSSAGADGGALFVNIFESPIESSTFANVSASSGGGVSCYGALNLTACTLSRNEASVSGGGVHLSSPGILTTAGTRLYQNVTKSGGGFY